ncbi:hypothetical protein QIG60_26730, partial [Klebsiella pneumoniae]|nr:hypothetical protein [Klebsiella pneumoniae]
DLKKKIYSYSFLFQHLYQQVAKDISTVCGKSHNLHKLSKSDNFNTNRLWIFVGVYTYEKLGSRAYERDQVMAGY